MLQGKYPLLIALVLGLLQGTGALLTAAEPRQGAARDRARRQQRRGGGHPGSVQP